MDVKVSAKVSETQDGPAFWQGKKRSQGQMLSHKLLLHGVREGKTDTRAPRLTARTIRTLAWVANLAPELSS